jgi:hypothetical protein
MELAPTDLRRNDDVIPPLQHVSGAAKFTSLVRTLEARVWPQLPGTRSGQDVLRSTDFRPCHYPARAGRIRICSALSWAHLFVETLCCGFLCSVSPDGAHSCTKFRSRTTANTMGQSIEAPEPRTARRTRQARHLPARRLKNSLAVVPPPVYHWPLVPTSDIGGRVPDRRHTDAGEGCIQSHPGVRAAPPGLLVRSRR